MPKSIYFNIDLAGVNSDWQQKIDHTLTIKKQKKQTEALLATVNWAFISQNKELVQLEQGHKFSVEQFIPVEGMNQKDRLEIEKDTKGNLRINFSLNGKKIHIKLPFTRETIETTVASTSSSYSRPISPTTVFKIILFSLLALIMGLIILLILL